MAAITEAFNRALYSHHDGTDEPSYAQQEFIRSYAIGTDHQFEDDSTIVRDSLFGGFAPRDEDAFSMPDIYMDDQDFDRSRYPDNWIGETSYYNIHDGKRHFVSLYDVPNGVLHIIDGHIFQLHKNGKILCEVVR